MPVIPGTIGNDILLGTDDPDIITGLAGDDIILGGAGDDLIDGGDDDDLLDGGIGADQLTGGAGDDTYYLDNLGDRIFELFGGGFDTVYTTVPYGLGAEIERLAVMVPTSTFAINLNGNDLDNEIWGNNGINYINGFAGADIMHGFGGNDSYVVDNVGDVVIEQAGGGSDIVFTSVDYRLSDNVERLSVLSVATVFAINLTGNSLANELIGNNGGNILNGGTGADVMQGYGGDDYYYATIQGNLRFTNHNNLGGEPHTYLTTDQPDVVVEHAGGGIDTVWVDFTSSPLFHHEFDYSIAEDHRPEMGPPHVERLGPADFASTYAVNFQGNSLANEVWGNDGPNILDGLEGADILRGHGGDDIYFVDNLGDNAVEEPGGGLDTIYLQFAPAIYTLPDNVERVGPYGFGRGGNTSFIGNALNNEIWGSAGNNIVDGGAGADIMRGHAGDDTYIVDNVNDVVIEYPEFFQYSGGDDLILTSVDYSMPLWFERMGVNGGSATTFAINLTGNGFANVLTGNDGANVLNGYLGIDTMSGFGGDDIYIVDEAGDVVIDSAGFDTIFTSVSYTLSTGVERMGVNGFFTTYAINLTGNDLENEIWGNAGANVLDGKGGADILHGNGGADKFAFSSTLDNFNVDQLIGFTVGDDKIALDDAIFIGLGLGALAPGAFTVGTAESHGDARIIYNSTTGGIYFDADGSDTGVAVLFATVHEGLPLSASDFVVI